MKKTIIILGLILSITILPTFVSAADIKTETATKSQNQSNFASIVSSIQDKISSFWGSKKRTAPVSIPKPSIDIPIVDDSEVDVINPIVPTKKSPIAPKVPGNELSPSVKVTPIDDSTNVSKIPVTAVVTPPASSDINAVLENSLEDKAGPWYQFTSGIGNGNKSGNDWKWSVNIGSSEKTVKRITVMHNIHGEIWSTGFSRYLADGTDLYGYKENPYPLVVYYNGKQMNTSYDQSLSIPDHNLKTKGGYELKLYGQIENGTFTGGKLIVEFTDGTSLISIIPATGKSYKDTVQGYNINSTQSAKTSVITNTITKPQSTTSGKPIYNNSYPTVVKPVNYPPTISSVKSSSLNLRTGEKGIWTVYATDREGGSLIYKAYWRDTVVPENNGSNNTMSHIFKTAGTYNIVFAVQDNAGNATPISVQVKVTGDTITDSPSTGTPPMPSINTSAETI